MSVSEVSAIPDLCVRFKAAMELFSELLASEGVCSRPYVSAELPHFSRLSVQVQTQLMVPLEHMLEVFYEVKKEGGSLADTPRLLWRSFRKLGWTPKSDVFDWIEDDDMIQVFNREHVALFRNLFFYDRTSYSLEELFVYPWYILCARDQKIADEIKKKIDPYFRGEAHETVNPEIETHFGEEAFSPERVRFQAKVKCFSPLYLGKNAVGVMVVTRTEVVGKN